MTDLNEHLRYDKMVEDALRGVVGEALRQVQDQGLPEEHHFYISFFTDYPGVSIPDYLKEQYPEEMTIVLQYQFWGLDIGNDAFAVTLSFNDIQERLTVPFAAITSFADPAVQFGLQFHASLDEDDIELALLDDEGNATAGGPVDLASGDTKKAAPKKKAAAKKKKDDDDEGNVVDLSSFRKSDE